MEAIGEFVGDLIQINPGDGPRVKRVKKAFTLGLMISSPALMAGLLGARVALHPVRTYRKVQSTLQLFKPRDGHRKK